MAVQPRRIFGEPGAVDDTAMLVYYGCEPQDWEEASDEKRFVEFIDGRIIVHSPAGLAHQRLFGFLHSFLHQYVERKKLGELLTGPLAMELALERKFEPDPVYLSPDTRAHLAENRLLGPADLAIEIASPSTAAYDRGEKRECYRVGGVCESWMIDPRTKLVIVDRPAGREVAQVSAGKELPGFWLKAEWLWREPLPPVADCLNEILATTPRN